MHNEHLKVEGEKMSKSSGNFFTLRELIEDKKLSPSAVRYTLISTHYRQRLNFTFEKIDASQKAINRLRELYRRLNESNSKVDNNTVNSNTDEMLRMFKDCLKDDLNISGALGKLFSWVNFMFNNLDKGTLSKKNSEHAIAAINSVDLIIGCIINNDSVSDDIEKLIKKREKARLDKNWELSDKIRDELFEKGIIIEDAPTGTIWKKK